MNASDTIYKRRSIRRYKPMLVSHSDIKKIVLAGMQAPSAKNRQPWRFIVVEGSTKKGMISAMYEGLEREKNNSRLPNSIKYISGVQNTIKIMEDAPVTIFIVNPLNSMDVFPKDMETRFYEVANLQSVGACIQNMLLASCDMGLGTLWNCDIFFAYDELSQWLKTNEQIVAAISIGLPAENPKARPRNNIDDLVEWKDNSFDF